MIMTMKRILSWIGSHSDDLPDLPDLPLLPLLPLLALLLLLQFLSRTEGRSTEEDTDPATVFLIT